MADCTDGVKSWEQIDTELQGAGWPGPYNHDQTEVDAYTRTAKCTPCVRGFNDTNRSCGKSSTTGPGTGALPASPFDWVKAHPIETGLGALVLVLVMRR